MSEPEQEYAEHIEYFCTKCLHILPLVFLHGAMGLSWDPFLDSLTERYAV